MKKPPALLVPHDLIKRVVYSVIVGRVNLVLGIDRVVIDPINWPVSGGHIHDGRTYSFFAAYLPRPLYTE